MSHTLSCSNMHPLINHVNCLTQIISLVALSITVNNNQPSSHFSYYMQHTQTHYNNSAHYIIIITHASNIWSRADVKTFYSFSYLAEDNGYFSARHWAYKYNTTTNAIHTVSWEARNCNPIVEVHVSSVSWRSGGIGLSQTLTRQVRVPWNKETLLQLSM
jgi:hypothetical protein